MSIYRFYLLIVFLYFVSFSTSADAKDQPGEVYVGQDINCQIVTNNEKITDSTASDGSCIRMSNAGGDWCGQWKWDTSRLAANQTYTLYARLKFKHAIPEPTGNAVGLRVWDDQDTHHGWGVVDYQVEARETKDMVWQVFKIGSFMPKPNLYALVYSQRNSTNIPEYYLDGYVLVPDKLIHFPVSPKDGEIISTQSPLLQWTAPSGNYHIQLSQDPYFLRETRNFTVVGTNYSLPAGELLAKGTWYWRVYPDDLPMGAFGETRCFHISPDHPEMIGKSAVILNDFEQGLGVWDKNEGGMRIYWRQSNIMTGNGCADIICPTGLNYGAVRIFRGEYDPQKYPWIEFDISVLGETDTALRIWLKELGWCSVSVTGAGYKAFDTFSLQGLRDQLVSERGTSVHVRFNLNALLQKSLAEKPNKVSFPAIVQKIDFVSYRQTAGAIFHFDNFWIHD